MSWPVSRASPPFIPITNLLPGISLRDRPPSLPEVAEPQIVRHYTRRSHLNYAVDTGFYPLGSCTMKYNPKLNDELAGLSRFSALHPYHEPSPRHITERPSPLSA